ncbi:MAG: hypothetical protein H6744_11310 [Deltaproteobacteria bacterium]|nr:hypothetical protein [Deltaproteobacteria bacterium]MCB9787269.1 hypothetical protein [Deltaproteobacteria bacterium]
MASLLLLSLTAWPVVYFWLMTPAGQAAVHDSLVRDLRPGSLDFRASQWGPDPQELWLCDAMIRTRAGQPAIGAAAIGGALSLGELSEGKVHFVRTRATDFEVRLGWDAEGRFSLAHAFREPGPEPTGPKPTPPLIRFDGIELERGLVTLDWPRFGLRFERVGAVGKVHLGGERGLYIEARLRGEDTRATLVEPERRLAFDGIRIDEFVWDGPGFSVRRLGLSSEAGAEVALGGELSFGEGGGAMHVAGSVRVGAAEVGEVLAQYTPRGFGLDGLVLDSRDGQATLAVERAQVDELLAGPVRVTGLVLPLRAEATGVGTLGQQGSVETHDAQARRVEGPDELALDEVRLGSLTARGGSTGGEAAVAGLEASALQLPAGTARKLRAEGTVKAGLAGGTLSGKVATASGRVDAEGKLGVNLLRRDLSVDLTLTLGGLEDALARTLLDALPAEVSAKLVPPLDGEATVSGRVGRTKDQSGRSRWGLEMTLESGEIRGRQRAELRDGTWVLADALAVPAP